MPLTVQAMTEMSKRDNVNTIKILHCIILFSTKNTLSFYSILCKNEKVNEIRFKTVFACHLKKEITALYFILIMQCCQIIFFHPLN